MNFFFNTLLNFMIAVANIYLTPVNQLVTNAFPDFAQTIDRFNVLVITYFGQTVSFFFNYLPPNCKSLILIYLSLLIICFTITISLHFILKVIEILRNIKVW